MNANITSRGGRAPPGQNTATPCAGSRWPDAAAQALAPAASDAPGRWPRLPAPARSCESSCAASVAYSRSWVRSNRSLPSVIHTHARAHESSAPHAHALPLNIGLVFPLLHPLKKWSLRESRGGSYDALFQPVRVSSARPVVARHPTHAHTSGCLGNGCPISLHRAVIPVRRHKRVTIGVTSRKGFLPTLRRGDCRFGEL